VKFVKLHVAEEWETLEKPRRRKRERRRWEASFLKKPIGEGKRVKRGSLGD